MIHNEVATVVKASKVYETPAWGFESEPFYNVAILIHTTKSAQKILNQVLKVEKKLGRIRSKDSGYQARIIDVDIIAFDEEIISTGLKDLETINNKINDLYKLIESLPLPEWRAKLERIPKEYRDWETDRKSVV